MRSDKPKRGRPRKVPARSNKPTPTVKARRDKPPNQKKTRGRPRKVIVVERKEALPEVTAAEKAENESKERSNKTNNRSIKQQLTETLNPEKHNIPIERTESAHVETVNDNVSSASEESSDLDIDISTVEEEPVENNPSDHKEAKVDSELDMEEDKAVQEESRRSEIEEEHEGVETESRIELELDMEPEDKGDEIEHDIQSLPMQRSSSRSSSNDSVVSRGKTST